MVETVWHAKPEIFSIWPFKEEICHSCSKSNKDDLFNKSVTVSVPCLKVFNPSGWVAEHWSQVINAHSKLIILFCLVFTLNSG